MVINCLFVMLFNVLSLMFCSDLLGDCMLFIYLFIYGVGACEFVFVVKPRLTLLIISGGSQGFCRQWAGECQGSPIV